VTYFGTKISYDMDGWTVVDQNRYTDLSTPFNAIINVGNARSLTGIARQIYDTAPARFAGSLGASGTPYFQVRDTATGAVIADQSNANSSIPMGMALTLRTSTARSRAGTSRTTCSCSGPWNTSWMVRLG